MFFARRSLSRASAMALVAASLAACSDSTRTRELTPEELEAVGSAIALEIEGAVSQLTVSGAMGTTEEPAFSLRSPSAGAVLGRAAYRLQRATSPVRTQTTGADCGTPSQDPPVDTDGDNVPDNLSITFSLPACHIAWEDGSMDLTGQFRISDPTPGTAGMALGFALDNFRVAFSGTDFSGWVVRNGSASVAATATGLSQTHDWTESARVAGFPGLAVSIDWTATFAAAQDQTITPGAPLPDGTYVPGGTIHFQHGDAASTLTVTTTTALQYSAACAAGVAEGTATTPFSSGEVRVAFSGQQGRGYALVTYASCGFATVSYVAAP